MSEELRPLDAPGVTDRELRRGNATCPKCNGRATQEPDVTHLDATGSVLRVEPGRIACKPCDKAALKDAKKSWKGNKRMLNRYALEHPTVPAERDLHKLAQEAAAQYSAHPATPSPKPELEVSKAMRFEPDPPGSPRPFLEAAKAALEASASESTPPPEPEPEAAAEAKRCERKGCRKKLVTGKRFCSRSCAAQNRIEANGKMPAPSKKLTRAVREPKPYETRETKPALRETMGYVPPCFILDDFETAAKLAREHTTAQLRAALALREALAT